MHGHHPYYTYAYLTDNLSLFLLSYIKFLYQTKFTITQGRTLLLNGQLRL
mgnify:CR=1 FL=1